ncbi:hypothetical protein ACFOPQ_01700 [Deinococcus antarcticus]|uniref:Uncharacterized protein n=1 Tax=Deinococcus antarcticus TaxID=1298767 RepID=A0ABV8A1C1_9DEIO
MELRWQDEGGQPTRESYRVFLKGDGEQWQLNPVSFSEWLLEPASDHHRPDLPLSSAVITQLADDLLRQESTEEAHPAGLRHIGLAWGAGVKG